MIDFQIYNRTWREYRMVATREDAVIYIAQQLAKDPSASPSDFIIYKRERVSNYDV